MRLPPCVIRFLVRKLMPLAITAPDEIIGHNARSRLRDGHRDPVERPFLLRWFVIPKNKWCNIYLHKFVRDDEDRALHDHPWFNLSIVLLGQYIEQTIRSGGVHWKQLFTAGAFKFRTPWAAHRVELTYGTAEYGYAHACGLVERHMMPGGTGKMPSWSLFITGPEMRKWGFHCPGEWRSSNKFHVKGGCND